MYVNKLLKIMILYELYDTYDDLYGIIFTKKLGFIR